MTANLNIKFKELEVYEGKKRTTYTVVWTIKGVAKPFRAPYGSKVVADAERARLMTAYRNGEEFSTMTGRPISDNPTPEVSEMRWFEFCCKYVDIKWKRAAGGYRRNLAEALTDLTDALVADAPGPKPTLKDLRAAMRSWAFSERLRAKKGSAPPAEFATALNWLTANTPPVADLGRPQTGSDMTRAMLDRISRKQNGKAAAANTSNRKRQTMTNVLNYAVEIDLLDRNPMGKVSWKATAPIDVIDPATVPNEEQAERLFKAAQNHGELGKRLVAFFAAAFWSGLRPEELIAARDTSLPEQLPAHGEVGEWRLTGAEPKPGGMWTDDGQARETRPLKHRDAGAVRTPPIPPELTPYLTKHLRLHPVSTGGRLFVGPRGGVPTVEGYGEVWRAARQAALTPDELKRGVAETVYLLRAACASRMLAKGVPATQVAEWMGHSVAVLLKIYARIIDGQAEAAKKKLKRKKPKPTSQDEQ